MKDLPNSGWVEKQLGEVVTITKTKGGSRPLPYVGLEDISSGGTGDFTGSLEQQGDKSTTFEFGPEHLLYGRLRPYLNKVYRPDFEGHCSSEIFPMLPDNCLDRGYLFHWITSDQVVEKINATSTGARMPRANVKEILQFPIPLPPLEEQQRIVAVLDEAFEDLALALAHAEANLQNAQDLFESLRFVMLTEQTEGWETRPLGDCFRLKSGENLTAKKMVPGPFPVYGGNGIAGTHDACNLSGDNVIIGRVGALCGNARHIDHDIWLTDNAFKVVNYNFDFDHRFLAYLLNFKNLRRHARQAAQPVISNSSLADRKLTFPASVELQAELANKLSDAETELEDIKKKYKANIQDLDDLRQSLLQKAFAGELT